MERRCWVNFQCWGVLLVWMIVGQGPIALAVGAGGGCLDIISLIYLFSFLSPSLWETARYRLKYCLKGPLNPKQPTNQYAHFIIVSLKRTQRHVHVEHLTSVCRHSLVLTRQVYILICTKRCGGYSESALIISVNKTGLRVQACLDVYTFLNDMA